MLFLMIKEPYKLDILDSTGNLIPEIELFNAHNYQIKEGSIESIVNSERVARYKEFDQLFTVRAEHLTKEGLHGKLNSDEAVLKDNVLHFKTNSHYEREDGIALDGESIFYDLKKEILSSENPFTFKQKQSLTNGLSFVYQMKEGTINANNIHSFVQEIGKRK